MTFVYGNNTGSSSTQGAVTVTPNDQNPTGWSVTAKDKNSGENTGFMLKDGATPLASKLKISKDGTTYEDADTEITYTGSGLTGAFPFYARQNIAGSDVAGAYTITIEFAGSILFND